MRGVFRTVFIVVLTTALQASAQTYDCAQTAIKCVGSSAEYSTLQAAANAAQPGDTVYVANGTYAGFETVRSGTVTQPILFKAASASVVVNSRNARTADNINVEGTDFNIIDGFTVTSSPRAGIRVVNAADVIVRNNLVSGSAKWGIFTGFAMRVQILNNKTSGSIGEHGIYVSNSDLPNDNPIVRGNESFGNNFNGIQFNGDCFSGGDGIIEGAIVENNRVHDNNFKGFSLISIRGAKIQNNVIYNNGINGGAGGIHFADEGGCNLPSNNNIAVNNTIVEPRIATIRASNNATGNIIFNNISVGSRGFADETGTNLIDSTSNLSRADTTGLFVNAAAGDYHPLSTSPALNIGKTSYSGASAPSGDMDAKNRSSNAPYDAGAYEYSVVVVDVVPPSAPFNLRVTE